MMRARLHEAKDAANRPSRQYTHHSGWQQEIGYIAEPSGLDESTAAPAAHRTQRVRLFRKQLALQRKHRIHKFIRPVPKHITNRQAEFLAHFFALRLRIFRRESPTV
jgi:hypothetical protein